MATEITTRIRAYRDGDATWDDTRQWLISHKYGTPERYKNPADPMLESDDAYYNDDGTWDEVETAFYMGLLTEDEYQQVLRALWEKSPKR